MAHISVDAKIVLETARARLQYFEQCRKNDDEDSIRFAMKQKHFFSRKPFTREDAIESLNNSRYIFGWRSCYGREKSQVLRELVILAKHGDPVIIDGKSAEILWGD